MESKLVTGSEGSCSEGNLRIMLLALITCWCPATLGYGDSWALKEENPLNFSVLGT